MSDSDFDKNDLADVVCLCSLFIAALAALLGLGAVGLWVVGLF